jgi:dienelactone hydrolase
MAGPVRLSVPSRVSLAGRSTTGRRRTRAAVAAVLTAVLAAGAGVWLLVDAAADLSRRQVVVDGVPLDEVHPAGERPGERRPGVVVAHGFAGSARLMTPFADTLSAQGYVVVLLDFAGHGANTNPLTDDTALQRDLEVAVTHLRGLPDVDPARVALVGHSMGATAITRYAVAHPEITATVAISLPDSSAVLPDRPARLLVLVGGLEFIGFRAAAEHTLEHAGRDRSVVVVPGVEHILILYAPRTHRETVAWLNDSFGGAVGAGGMPSPMRRPSAAGLLLLCLLAGLYPLARLVLGGGPAKWPPVAVPELGRIVAVAAAAATAAMALAPIALTVRLPLAVGGFLVGFTTIAGAGMLGYCRWRAFSASVPIARPNQPSRPSRSTRLSRLRLAVAAPVLVGYAGLTIAVPLHLGLTNALPVGARWWLLAAVWVGFSILAYATERVAGGNSFGVLAVSVVMVGALTSAAVLGLTSGFLLLVVPLLAVLMLGQALWSAVLHRFSAPSWLIAMVGSLLVAWPIAVALPITG